MVRASALSLGLFVLSGCGQSASEPDIANLQKVPASVAHPIKPGTALKLDWEASGDPHSPQIIVRTNLPDGAALSVTAFRPDIKFSADGGNGPVQGGMVTARLFDKPPLPGRYKINIGTPFYDIQPQEVKRLVGLEYENLTGPYFVDDDMGRRVDRDVTLIIPGTASARDKASEITAHNSELRRQATAGCRKLRIQNGDPTMTPKAVAAIESCARVRLRQWGVSGS